MKERFKTASAVMLMKILIMEKCFFYKKSKNTGFADGRYDFSATGHVEENESMKVAVCREAKEELDIIFKPEDLEFVSLMHINIGKGSYYSAYFKTTKWEGIPKINEPNKNEELKWVNINELPENTIIDRKEIVKNYINNIKYCEYGWIK